MGAQHRFEAASAAAGRDLEVSRAALAVLKAGALVARELERALGDAALTLPQFNVLMALAASPAGTLPMHAVMDQMLTTPPNLSWLTSKMRDAGLVTKERDPANARVVLLSITASGWDAVERAMPAVFDTEKRLMRECSADDLRTVQRLLVPVMEQ